MRIRAASPTDAPTLMHIEHSSRVAALFLPVGARDPGTFRPRQWRAWLLCAPPYDRHAMPRSAFVVYENNDVLGFVACVRDSLFGGYGADIAGIYVLPRHRRMGIGGMLLVQAARWLQEDGIGRVTADCFAHDPGRSFFDRMGGVVIASTSDEGDRGAVITYGFANLRELAAKGCGRF